MKPTSAVDKKGKGKDRVKSATKKGKGTQEPQKLTKLKKRGEEDDDIQFIGKQNNNLKHIINYICYTFFINFLNN